MEVPIIRYLDAQIHLSMAGWYVCLGNALIFWKCEKKDQVFKSTTKAEYGSVFCVLRDYLV